ncbi:MAG: AraC family transcriptional regulator [Clostridia bacterium]
MKKATNRTQSFLKKVFLSFLLLAVLITVMLTAFLTFTYFKATVETANRFCDKLIAQSNYSIAYVDETAKRLSNALLSDHQIITYLNMKKTDSLAAVRASQALDRHLLTLSGFESVYLYNAQLDMFYSSKTGEQSNSEAFSDHEIAALLTDASFTSAYRGKPIAFAPAQPNEIAKRCSYIVFESSANAQGRRNAIVVNVSTKLLSQSIQAINTHTSASDSTFLVLNEKGVPLSATYGRLLKQNPEHMQQVCREAFLLEGTGNRVINVEGTRYMVTFSRQNANGWCVLSIIPAASIFGEVGTAAVLAAVLVIFAFALCIGICYVLAKRLNSPVQAMKRILSGEKTQLDAPMLSKTEEFGFILSVFESMREQNEQLDRLKRENSHLEKQDLLAGLLAGTSPAAEEGTCQRLEQLELDYLTQGALCMCLFKIDRYSQMVSINSKKERWALRFAIVDVVTEVAQRELRCEVFNCASDQFVMLVRCDQPFNAFREELELLLRQTQKEVSECLQVSLSIAYSTLFKGLEHLPSMYANMKSSMMLKFRYGHGCIISPYVLDEVNADDFRLPLKLEGQLTERALAGEPEAAMAIYREINKRLYRYSYNEIMSCVMHLVYSIYSMAMERSATLKNEQDFLLKDFIRDLRDVEVAADIDELMERFLLKVSAFMQTQAEPDMSKTSDLIIQRVMEIIQSDYPDPSLCLSAVAEKLHLSPNYIGHLFKLAQGQSIAQYILEYRMNQLVTYMRTTKLSLNAILEKVGLEKNNYFYTRFKKTFGMSLGEFKLQLSKTEEGC